MLDMVFWRLGGKRVFGTEFWKSVHKHEQNIKLCYNIKNNRQEFMCI